MGNKQKVVDLLKSIETGATEPVGYINPHKYIQHNLAAEDGLAGFGKLLQQLPPKSAKVNTVRVFEDGPFVFVHTEYNFFGPKIGFDIFRFEDGKIVEHWDNLQEKPENANPGGHTMTDGPTAIADLNKTEENKTLVKNAMSILVSGQGMGELAKFFDGDRYINHNSKASDGLSGLAKGMAERAKLGIITKYEKVHKVLGEGNFVLTVTEGSISGKPTSFYDLFRVENGKIAEHWDVVQEIPAREDWKNNNGKF
ncbi:hypothetical protein HB364_04570 [Pseudoflavitalea sp. X16]|nr:hypothetical protein [Paraflavitalea devenefica]